MKHNFIRRDYEQNRQLCGSCGYNIPDETLLEDGDKCQGFNYWIYRETGRKIFRIPPEDKILPISPMLESKVWDLEVSLKQRGHDKAVVLIVPDMSMEFTEHH